MKLIIKTKGGEGSGNFGHAGIPGHQGGSAPSGIGSDVSETEPQSSVDFKVMNSQLRKLGWERGGDSSMELSQSASSRKRNLSVTYRAEPNFRDGTYRLAYMSNNRFDKLSWSYMTKEYKTAAGVNKAARAHFDKMMLR